jgi:hypothetical protein
MLDRGSRNYDNIDREKVEAILKALSEHGSQVTGNNPWTVDTGKHGVVLKGEWDEESLTLTIALAHAGWYVPRKKVWEHIDSLMRQLRDAG